MSDNAVERKVETQTVQVESKKQVLPFEIGNILHGYRSYTYNFTLAALPKEKVNDPSSYKDKPLDFIILKSGGKGTNEFVSSNAADFKISRQEDINGNTLVNELVDTEVNKELVNDFNKKSPGRFDMYINDVEIETLTSYAPQTNTTLATGVKFNVYEPYSINGFISALHVGAVAAGYPNYINASFLLKMTFLGYPDNVSLSEPEEIKDATRYFLIRFKGIDVELTEQGTRYRCEATPFHESGFGIPNILQNNIAIEGKQKVKEVLKDFQIKLNEQQKKIAKESKNLTDAAIHDEYEIKFLDENFKEVESNAFGDAEIFDLLKTEAVYSFEDYGNELKVDEKGFVKLNPNKMVIQFRQQARISECIAAIIRDSNYTKGILLKLGEPGNKLIDQYGMVQYFIVTVAVTPKKFDPVNNRMANIYTYSIAPYKVHFTRIPRYKSQKYNASKLDGILGREYNYLYSGQNKDVINFKLNFNSLFVEAVSRATGNSAYSARSNALGSTNDGAPTSTAVQDLNNLKRDQNGTPPTYTDPTSENLPETGTAGIPKLNPYDVLARKMHEAIVDSWTSLITGTVEILGDPVFLVTPSPGKVAIEKSTNPVFTKNGELNYQTGDVLIKINFRNPVDIGEDGFYEFDQNQVPYGGVYRVLTVTSSFRDGVFRQVLNIQRLTGQINDQPNLKETKLSDVAVFRPRPQDQQVQDTSKAPKNGQRLQPFNLLTRLQDISSGAVAFTSGLASSLTAPLSDAVNKFNKNLSEANQNVVNVTSKITSAINKVNLEVAQVGEKLGISPQNLANASPLALISLTALAKSLPQGTDLKASQDQGVNLNFAANKLVNLPPVQPASVAPPAEQNQIDIQDIIKLGGVAALASAFGTNSPNRISGSVLPANQLTGLVRDFTKPEFKNPLAGQSNFLSAQDLNVRADKSLTRLSQASNSVEVNLKTANASLDSALDRSVTTQFGSKLSSPLVRLNDLNNT